MSEQETPRTVEEAARALRKEAALEARQAAREIVPGTSEKEALWRDGFVRGAAWRAARMPSEEQVAEVLAGHLLTSRVTKEGRAVACCSCGADLPPGPVPPNMGAHVDHQAEQVVALWGAP